MRVVELLACCLAVGCGRVGFEPSSGDANGMVQDGSNAPNDGAGNDSTLDVGLVARWTFDEGNGTTAADSSGYSNTLTLINGPVWGTGMFGGDLTFNGTNQEADSAAGLNVSSVLSFSFWLNSNTNVAGDVFSIGLYAACEINYSPGILACSPNGGGVQLTSPVSSSQWHLITYVSDGDAATHTLYVDGVLADSAVATWNFMASKGVCVGSGCGGIYAKASIDEVRVYNRALTAAEVNALL